MTNKSQNFGYFFYMALKMYLTRPKNVFIFRYEGYDVTIKNQETFKVAKSQRLFVQILMQ